MATVAYTPAQLNSMDLYEGDGSVERLSGTSYTRRLQLHDALKVTNKSERMQPLGMKSSPPELPPTQPQLDATIPSSWYNAPAIFLEEEHKEEFCSSQQTPTCFSKSKLSGLKITLHLVRVRTNILRICN